MSTLTVNQPFFFSGCPVQATAPDACQPQEEENFQYLAPALAHIFNSVPQDAIMAFGYTHRELVSQRSAVEIFTKNIIPQLSARGYTDLVLEVFPKGNPTDAIEIEIEEFNRSGTIGTEMNRFLNVVDRASFEFLLQQARAHGITIHSGGVNYDNVFQTIWYPNFQAYPQRVEMVRQEVARNTEDRISLLANQGLKVFSLNGTAHNDIYPAKKNVTASFGKTLNALFPNRFVEIDMVLPELSERKDYYKDLPLSSKCFWRKFIPSTGINLVSELGPRSYLLFWPKP
jgi:hypothetical protein